MRRYADTFFRHWIIALLPIFLLPLGALAVGGTPKSTIVSTNVWVNQVTVGQLSGTDASLTASQNLATYLTQFLQSPSFDLRVAQGSPRYWQTIQYRADRTNVVVGDLSKNVSFDPTGSHLLTITYSAKDPTIALQVVRSLLREGPYEIYLLNKQESRNGLASYSSQARSAQGRLTRAAQALGVYMQQHNVPSKDVAVQVLYDPRLSALYQAVQSAQTEAQKAETQVAQILSQGLSQSAFQVVDPPSRQPDSKSSKKKAVTNLIIALIVGILLSGAFIVGATLIDRSLRHPDDVPDVLGLPVIGIVPYSEARSKIRQKTG